MNHSDGQDNPPSTERTTEYGRPSSYGRAVGNRFFPDGLSKEMRKALDDLGVGKVVESPPHYTYGDIEVIDFIEQVVKHYPQEIGFHIANVLKYVARGPHKNNLAEDLSKASFYLNRAISKL